MGYTLACLAIGSLAGYWVGWQRGATWADSRIVCGLIMGARLKFGDNRYVLKREN